MASSRKTHAYSLAIRLLVSSCAVGACSQHPTKDPLARDEARVSAAPDAGAVDPNSIAALEVYADIAAGTANASALEFTPDYPLWSDGAHKRRWVMLPEDRQIDTSDMDHWKFPVGTKFVKEFSLDGVRLETRVIERLADTGVMKKDLALTVYVWNEEQTDAQLAKDGVVDLLGTPHDVPRQKDCIACHVGEASGTLGFSAIQLSESGMLASLEERGLLSDPPGRTFALPGNDVERAAIGMLHANCGHCHTEGSPADVMRLRVLVSEVDKPFDTWELYRTTLGEAVTNWSPRPDAYGVRLVPGVPDASALLYRMERRESETSVGEQMPPLASEQVDMAGVAAVRAWIAAMPRKEPPPSQADAATQDGTDAAVSTGTGSELDAGMADASAPEMDSSAVSTDASSEADADSADAGALDSADAADEVMDAGNESDAADQGEIRDDAGATEVAPDA
jgi:hypothetical protein